MTDTFSSFSNYGLDFIQEVQEKEKEQGHRFLQSSRIMDSVSLKEKGSGKGEFAFCVGLRPRTDLMKGDGSMRLHAMVLHPFE